MTFNFFVRSEMINRNKFIKILIILLIFVVGIFCRVYAAITPSERTALIELYNSTDGDNWTFKSKWKDGELETDGFAELGTENNWYGISCDPGNTMVSTILMGYNNLNGTIPGELGNLTNLQYLGLSGNQLTGGIPVELEKLTKLQSLFLSSNQLSGSIPAELGNLPSLYFLDLNNNQLSGNIPDELGNLMNLQQLYLNNNQLSGNIPAGLGSLASLNYLYLDNNVLSGNIPEELGNLTSLFYLYLNNNQLSGSIPTELGKLYILHYLYLNNNQLSGSIPAELGSLTNLKRLYLNKNQLSGSIPAELGTFTNLQHLYLNGNQLSGAIPASLTSLDKLTQINISYNALYTEDNDLLTFLDSKTPGWEDTQTIAPKDINIDSNSQSSVVVSWSPIKYTENSGGYRVLYSTTSGGPYTLFGTTDDKMIAQMEVTGLNADTTYYLVVQTLTEPHFNNLNTVYSEYSEEVSATTLPLPVIPTLSINDITIAEDANNAIFVITASSIAEDDINVDYTFSNETALEGSDYYEFSGTATIFSDTNTAEIRVYIVDDQDLEADETFLVILSNPINATIGDDTGVATIIDNDNMVPKADVGLDKIVKEGTTITLDGSRSTDSNDEIDLYRWSQISGTSVTLSDPNAVKPTFVTPPVNTDSMTLSFRLTVEDNYGKQDTDELSITINDNGIAIFPNDVIAFNSSTGKDMGIKMDSDDHLISLIPIDPNTITETVNRPETFIYGLIELGIKVNNPGDTAIIIIYLPEPAPEGYRWYQYTTTGGWIDFSRDVISGGNGDGAEFIAGRTQVKLYITDNGPYDSDDNDLIIKDPSGLATALSTPTESIFYYDGGGGCFIGNLSSASEMKSFLNIRHITFSQSTSY